VSAGPGRATSISLQLLFWVALASASFACLDFYFQFPAPAGFEAQYVWLASGIYRRAQGLFYEASTLANFCAFFLVMIAVALVRRVANRPLLLSAGVVFASALIFSYSRAAVLGVGVALTTLLLLERTHLAFRRLVWIVAGALAAGLAIVYQVFPRFAEAYWSRISYAATNFSSSADRILTGRVESWQTLIGFLAENPWHAIFGVGYKTLPYSDFIGQRVVSDNMYLSALVETGIVGLGALLVLNFAILRAGYTAARSSDSEKSFYGTWIFCFWTAQMVQMLSADVLTFWRVMPVYLWVLAMAVRKRVPL
jgi:O-antigen ligase